MKFEEVIAKVGLDALMMTAAQRCITQRHFDSLAGAHGAVAMLRAMADSIEAEQSDPRVTVAAPTSYVLEASIQLRGRRGALDLGFRDHD